MRRLLLILLLLAGGPFALASAQTAAPVSLSPWGWLAVAPYVTGTAADSGTVNKQLTVTITPPSGQYVYVVGYDWTACQDDAADTALTNATFMTTGFTNLPKIGHVSLAATNAICALPRFHTFGSNPVRSRTPGGAVTFVSPAATTHLAFTLNVYAYTAP